MGAVGTLTPNASLAVFCDAARRRVFFRECSVNSRSERSAIHCIVLAMTTVLERRVRPERRRRSIRAYWHGTQLVRRKAGRRAGDLYALIDWYSPAVLAAATSILVLSCCDSLLTMHLLGRGAVEANPVMALLLLAGMGWFTTVKFACTALAVVVMAACSEMRLFRAIRGAVFLYGVLACYVLLIGYECQLAWR
jgi:hypothetical protein